MSAKFLHEKPKGEDMVAQAQGQGGEGESDEYKAGWVRSTLGTKADMSNKEFWV